MDEKTLKKCLGKKIRQYRKIFNMTQDKLGEKIDRDQRQVSMIETGACYPTPETLVKIASAFDCTPRDLFDFEPFETTENIKTELYKITTKLTDDKLKILYVLGKIL